MRQFQELGALVEARWRSQNYAEAAFPDIASDALRESDLISQVDPWDIIRWVHTTPNLPPQQDRKAKFGNPPITLFSGARFYIDVYYWLDGTTSIHQHAFSGAFQVLLGSSVHSHYRFEKELEINPHFLVGKVLLQDVSLLARGDIKPIRPGVQFIHSLFHLERPSATLTVRSHHAAHDAVQYDYLPPTVALDQFYEEDALSKKVQTVSLLLSMKHPEADRIIKDLLADADFHTAYAVLDTAFGFLGSNRLEGLFQLSKSRDRFQDLLECARRKHDRIVDLLPAVFEERQRQEDIVRRRRLIEGKDHRFFLALLLNVPERVMVLDLMKQRFPERDPVDLALKWIAELGGIRIFGSHEPNVLGLKNYDPSWLPVFAGLLRGLTDEEGESHTDSQRLPGTTFREVAASIRTSSLFKSIFRP